MRGEPQAEIAGGLARGADQVVTSILSYAECRAAIAAAVRTTRMRKRDGRLAVSTLNQLWPSLHRVAATEAVVQTAGELAERQALCGFDAIQLASALVLGRTVTLACWDRHLVRAAREEGLTVRP